jgi:hypothetical protein
VPRTTRGSDSCLGGGTRATEALKEAHRRITGKSPQKNSVLVFGQSNIL